MVAFDRDYLRSANDNLSQLPRLDCMVIIYGDTENICGHIRQNGKDRGDTMEGFELHRVDQ